MGFNPYFVGDESGSSTPEISVLVIFCFNPYFVGDESGSISATQSQVTKTLVSILILLEMSLEDSRHR